jgi:hypothetical protein
LQTLYTRHARAAPACGTIRFRTATSQRTASGRTLDPVVFSRLFVAGTCFTILGGMAVLTRDLTMGVIALVPSLVLEYFIWQQR